MNISTEVAEAIFTAAGEALAQRIGAELDSLQCVTIKEAAKTLSVSQAKARRLINEYVELGEASRRVTLATLRKLIESRTIKGRP